MADNKSNNGAKASNLIAETKLKGEITAKILKKASELLRPDGKPFTTLSYEGLTKTMFGISKEAGNELLMLQIKEIANPKVQLDRQSLEFFKGIEKFFKDVNIGNDFFGKAYEASITYGIWYQENHPMTDKKRFSPKNLKVKDFYNYCLKANHVKELPKFKNVTHQNLSWEELDNEAINIIYNTIKVA